MGKCARRNGTSNWLPLNVTKRGNLPDVGGELVEVDALDEQGQPAAAQSADHRHLVVVGRQARGLDVQEEGPAGEVRVEPPHFPAGQAAVEEVRVTGGDGTQGLAHQRGGRLVDALPQCAVPNGLQEAVPVQYPLFPERPLPMDADARQVDEGVTKHD